MSVTQRTVDDDTVVSLDYSLRLDNGEVIDRSSGDEPLQFIQGYEEIIPGLENALYGMIVGEEKLPFSDRVVIQGALTQRRI